MMWGGDLKEYKGPPLEVSPDPRSVSAKVGSFAGIVPGATHYNAVIEADDRYYIIPEGGELPGWPDLQHWRPRDMPDEMEGPKYRTAEYEDEETAQKAAFGILATLFNDPEKFYVNDRGFRNQWPLNHVHPATQEAVFQIWDGYWAEDRPTVMPDKGDYVKLQDNGGHSTVVRIETCPEGDEDVIGVIERVFTLKHRGGLSGVDRRYRSYHAFVTLKDPLRLPVELCRAERLDEETGDCWECGLSPMEHPEIRST